MVQINGGDFPYATPVLPSRFFSSSWLAIALEAQGSDRLYPFRELTDEMRARIDLRDGSVEDWLDVLGEPTLTALDFATHAIVLRGTTHRRSTFVSGWLGTIPVTTCSWPLRSSTISMSVTTLIALLIGTLKRQPFIFLLMATGVVGRLVETGVDNVVIRDITMGQAQEYWAAR